MILKAIKNVLNQYDYEAILSVLEHMSQFKTDIAPRTVELPTKFPHGNTYMALILAADIIGQLEILNNSLQSQKMSGVTVAIDEVIKSLNFKRTNEHFHELIDEAIAKQAELDHDEMHSRSVVQKTTHTPYWINSSLSTE